jgi:hypothetical protein
VTLAARSVEELRLSKYVRLTTIEMMKKITERMIAKQEWMMC